MSELCSQNLIDWQTVEDMLSNGSAERPDAPPPHVMAAIVTTIAGDVADGRVTVAQAIAHGFDVGSVMGMLGYLNNVAYTCEHC